MKFHLLDRITRIVPDTVLEGIRALTLGEEYLADHFPGNPVMPGVLMLESMVQAAAWLIRVSTGFAKSMVLLREARNVKYGKFVEPGDTLRICVEKFKEVGNTMVFRAKGMVNGQAVVSARLVMEFFNLADRDPALAANDELVLRNLRRHLHMIASREVLEAAGITS